MLQDTKGKPLRLTNKAQLKRLQSRPSDANAEDQSQPESAAVTVITDAEDAAIEEDLAQIKAERLKRIQALPSTVWT